MSSFGFAMSPKALSVRTIFSERFFTGGHNAFLQICIKTYGEVKNMHFKKNHHIKGFLDIGPDFSHIRR